MACLLRVLVRRKRGEAILQSRSFGRRQMFEAGGPRERGKGPWMGINVTVGDRDWFDFRGQLADARRFLKRYEPALRDLTSDRAVRSAGLDFGVGDAIDGGRGKAVVMYFRLPDDLVTMAGRLGLYLEVSIYPVMRRMTKSGLR